MRDDVVRVGEGVSRGCGGVGRVLHFSTPCISILWKTVFPVPPRLRHRDAEKINYPPADFYGGEGAKRCNAVFNFYTAVRGLVTTRFTNCRRPFFIVIFTFTSSFSPFDSLRFNDFKPHRLALDVLSFEHIVRMRMFWNICNLLYS